MTLYRQDSDAESGVRSTVGVRMLTAEYGQGISAVTQRRFIRMGLGLAAVCAAGFLTACGPVYDPKGFSRVMSPSSTSRVDTALAAMSRGEYGVAEQSLSAALEADPKDPYALLAMGMLYQNTGRPQKAEAMYQQILLLNPTAMISSGPWGDLRQRPVRDVAEENLQALGGGNRSGAISYAPMKRNDLPSAPSMGVPQNGLGAAGQRFAVFKALVDENLATPEEWMARRAQNIGALLPLTHSAPGAGLDRPSPDARAVGNRLKALAAAFEGRGISASQHALERQAILDGVLPEQPRVRASAPPVPRGVMEAADAIGRLDRLRAGNVITPEEYEEERAAIERALRGGSPRPNPPAKPAEPPPAAAAPQAPQQLMPPPSAPGAPANAQPGASINNPAAVLQTGRMANQTVPDPADFNNPDAESPIGAGGIVAVHLASFKNQELADKGWKEMITRYPDLATITPRVTQVTLPDQGTVYRLNAGPFADRAKAQEFCGKLKGQYCEVVFLGG